MDRLSHIDNARLVRPLPDLAALANHEGVVSDESGLIERLNVSIAEDVLSPFADGERPSEFTFTPRQLAAFGKEKSFRGAFFGVLKMKSRDGVQVEEPVVVKQYPLGGQHDASHNAAQELTMLAHAKAVGLSTVDVVGAIVDRYSANPLVYVITRQKQGLESMDELRWRGITTAQMPDRLHPVVDTLVSMHTKLLFSGDPKFKNIGLGEDGSPIIFDLEHATSLRDLVEHMTPENQDEVMDRLTKRMMSEFAHVASSLDSIIYPNLPQGERPRTPLERFNFEFTHVLELYHMRILESGSRYRDVLNQAYGRMLEKQHSNALRLQAEYDSHPR
ncbi:MAG TPA: hypothetical protein VLF71_05915 [Candidatus Saccharimonadales bacterium]|nr:hypothetical protein [Candidatus Saccharimonadales bacterium]